MKINFVPVHQPPRISNKEILDGLAPGDVFIQLPLNGQVYSYVVAKKKKALLLETADPSARKYIGCLYNLTSFYDVAEVGTIEACPDATLTIHRG